jgi:hypothetical protein
MRSPHSAPGSSGGARRGALARLGDRCRSAQEIHDGVRSTGRAIGRERTGSRHPDGARLLQRVDLGTGSPATSLPRAGATITTTWCATTAGASSRSTMRSRPPSSEPPATQRRDEQRVAPGVRTVPGASEHRPTLAFPPVRRLESPPVESDERRHGPARRRSAALIGRGSGSCAKARADARIARRGDGLTHVPEPGRAQRRASEPAHIGSDRSALGVTIGTLVELPPPARPPRLTRHAERRSVVPDEDGRVRVRPHRGRKPAQAILRGSSRRPPRSGSSRWSSSSRQRNDRHDGRRRAPRLDEGDSSSSWAPAASTRRWATRAAVPQCS